VGTLSLAVLALASTVRFLARPSSHAVVASPALPAKVTFAPEPVINLPAPSAPEIAPPHHRRAKHRDGGCPVYYSLGKGVVVDCHHGGRR
jgi:hypothetical protein